MATIEGAMEGAFSSWTWDIVLYAGGFSLIVFLVMGPAMWSSTNEFMIARLWRLWRARRSEARTPAASSETSKKRSGAISD